MKPFLSILIPSRNRAKYLKYAIQSALNLESSSIQIVVSENYSSDNSWEVCGQFRDPRLTIIRPPKPLSMADHFEFILRQALGEWVTFIGDDDAVMPHCVEHLKYLTSRYPQAEAICAPRAYYFWDESRRRYGGTVVSFQFSQGERWLDSKSRLQDCLEAKFLYIHLPQMYSGGFHRRSLINRVYRSQNGVYFKSVSPDAYTAIMACLHTYRYLEVGVPLTWVGTSPSGNGSANPPKDRKNDFSAMFDESPIVSHAALGRLNRDYITFPLVFLEAYLAAAPLTSLLALNSDLLKVLYSDAVRQFRASGDDEAIRMLSEDLGFSPASIEEKSVLMNFTAKTGEKVCGLLKRVASRIGASQSDKKKNGEIMSFRSTSVTEFSNILSCDSYLRSAYEDWGRRVLD